MPDAYLPPGSGGWTGFGKEEKEAGRLENILSLWTGQEEEKHDFLKTLQAFLTVETTVGRHGMVLQTWHIFGTKT